jgi:hypothetical protein
MENSVSVAFMVGGKGESRLENMKLDREFMRENIFPPSLSAMRAIVTHFLRLEILNLHPMVYWGMAGVWVLLLFSAFASVRSLSISTGAKIAWSLVILVLPIFGLSAYAIRCLFRSNWHALKPWFQSRRVDRQLSSPRPSSDPVAKA